VLILDENATRAALPWAPLIRAIREQFVAGCEMPVRHHHTISMPNEEDGTLLLMPAWLPGKYIGVKQVTVIPGNTARGLPAVAAAYFLSSGKTGESLAVLDGGELTARRTAATSALAADFLARDDARKLLIVGAGRLSLNLIQAHSSVRPVSSIRIWARRIDQAAQVAQRAKSMGFSAEPVEELEAAVRDADIVSTCTLSHSPLVRGGWLQPGTHLDLVGAFKATMRESDDEAVRRSTLFVDTRGGATTEGGDIVQPIASGVISETDIAADLFDLCRGRHVGRKGNEEITLFKSVGAAIEDLAAARLAYEG